MSVLKYYDTGLGQWIPVEAGAVGATGATGPIAGGDGFTYFRQHQLIYLM